VDQASIPFLDVNALLERSQPQQRASYFWYGVGLFLLIVLISVWSDTLAPAAASAVRVLSGVVMFGAVIVMAVYTQITVRSHRAEQVQLEAIEELVTLRRWPQAAVVLESMLSQPTRTPQARIKALIFLTSVLGRYHRFDDAINVQTYLLQNVHMDGGTEHALRLGRAMAMLREDHLVDADRAISELRRSTRASAVHRNAEDDMAEVSTRIPESAGLALIEMYRDVKTGHPAEAIEIFDARLPLLRRQLGHRVADAYGLAAKALDLQGKTDEAQSAFEKATLLAPAGELVRRYPELSSLLEKYRSAAAPAEAA
jgi:tetratricopeptide (TPR) repeat protein